MYQQPTWMVQKAVPSVMTTVRKFEVFFLFSNKRIQHFSLEKEKHKFSSMTSTRLFQNKEACITQKLFRNELPSTSSENPVLYLSHDRAENDFAT